MNNFNVSEFDRRLSLFTKQDEEIIRLKESVKGLLKIIDDREHDIACLESELRQAKDLVGTLQDKVREKKLEWEL